MALRKLRNIKNPIEYGGMVSGNSFCNREKKVADLLRAIENNEKLFTSPKNPSSCFICDCLQPHSFSDGFDGQIVEL